MEKLEQIKTLTLRDYIHEKMTKLHNEGLELLGKDSEDLDKNFLQIVNNNCQLIALQDIAYRLEFGFIVEIGNKSLKEHLAKPI